MATTAFKTLQTRCLLVRVEVGVYPFCYVACQYFQNTLSDQVKGAQQKNRDISPWRSHQHLTTNISKYKTHSESTQFLTLCAGVISCSNLQHIHPDTFHTQPFYPNLTAHIHTSLALFHSLYESSWGGCLSLSCVWAKGPVEMCCVYIQIMLFALTTGLHPACRWPNHRRTMDPHWWSSGVPHCPSAPAL